MKELRRWSEEGATSEELRILASARSIRPSAPSRARMTAALGIGASGLWASSASGATTASAGLYLKLLSVVLAVSVAGGVAWHFAGPSLTARSSARPEAPIHPPNVENMRVIASAAVGDPASSAMPAASSTDEASVPVPGGGRSAAGRPRGAPAPAASLRLSEEVENLERARSALATKSPEAALRELHAYNQRFPHGELASEETVLRVQALLARGQNEKAAALADRFAAAHPESPLASRVQELVRVAHGKP